MFSVKASASILAPFLFRLCVLPFSLFCPSSCPPFIYFHPMVPLTSICPILLLFLISFSCTSVLIPPTLQRTLFYSFLHPDQQCLKSSHVRLNLVSPAMSIIVRPKFKSCCFVPYCLKPDMTAINRSCCRESSITCQSL